MWGVRVSVPGGKGSAFISGAAAFFGAGGLKLCRFPQIITETTPEFRRGFLLTKTSGFDILVAKKFNAPFFVEKHIICFFLS